MPGEKKPKSAKPPGKKGDRPKGRKGKAKGSRMGTGDRAADSQSPTHARRQTAKELAERLGEATRVDPERTEQLALATVGDAAKSDRERHLDEVIALMARGEFLGGPTVDQLIEKWGYARTSVEDLVSEASRTLRRLVRFDHTDDGLRAILCSRLAMLGEEARKKTRIVRERVRNKAGELHFVPFEDPDPDYPSALRAVELQAKLLGLLRQTVEHSGPEGGPIPIEAAAVVVLPAQNADGGSQAAQGEPLETKGEPVDQGKGNGGRKAPRRGNGAKRGNGKGNGNGRG